MADPLLVGRLEVVLGELRLGLVFGCGEETQGREAC